MKPAPRPPARLLVLLVFVSMLAPFSMNVLMPSLPGLEKVFAAPRETVQLTVSLFIVGMAVSQLLSGALADRFGRRPVLIGAIMLYLAASAMAALAGSIETLAAARVLQALGATAGITLSRAIVRDLFARESAASMIGYVTMGMVVAPMLAPGLGGLLDEAYGWRAVFVACGVLGAAAMLAVALVLPETRPAAAPEGGTGAVLRRAAGLFRRPLFLAYAAIATFASAIFFTFIGAAPYLVIEVMGLSKVDYGLWFVFCAGGYMLGNLASGRLSVRFGIDRMVHWGNILGVASTAIGVAAVLAFPLSPPALFVPAFFMSIGNGLVLPNAIAGAVSVDPGVAGGASGLLGFAQMGLGAIATFIAGTMLSGGAVATAVGMLAWAALALVVSLAQVRPGRVRR